MILHKLISSCAFFVALTTTSLFANCCHHHSLIQHVEQSYGKLSASPEIETLTILTPQVSLPSLTGWQPFPVDTFSTFLRTTSDDPTNATITVKNSGTYLINALLTLQYPDPGTDGPDDLTGYCIGLIINGELQLDSIGSLHISTEAGNENPGLLFSASLSDLITLPKNSTIQFVVSGSNGSGDPAYMIVASANGTVVQVGN